MLRTLIPKRSGVHRFASLSLYRALLRQCRNLPNTIPNSHAIRDMIPKKFHQYKKLDSPTQIAHSLKAGYEAFDLLHSASQGNQDDIRRITTLLTESEKVRNRDSPFQREMTRAKRAIPKTASQIRREEVLRFQESTSQRYPNAPSILERPRREIKGKRRIPVLVNARGLPMLRIKKPQPKFLSGVIRSKLRRRERRVDFIERTKYDVLLAKDEDHWDSLTVAQKDGSWAREILSAISETRAKIKKADIKSKKLADAMWNVVLRERELAAEEEKQRSSAE